MCLHKVNQYLFCCPNYLKFMICYILLFALFFPCNFCGHDPPVELVFLALFFTELIILKLCFD